MKRHICVIIFAFAYFINYSQTWERIGGLNRPAQSFFDDAEEDKFYIGGSFGYFNDDTLRSIFSYDGQSGIAPLFQVFLGCRKCSEGSLATISNAGLQPVRNAMIKG